MGISQSRRPEPEDDYEREVKADNYIGQHKRKVEDID